jgi:hypothetical protein
MPSGNLSQRSSASELNTVSSFESFHFSELSANSPNITVVDDASSDESRSNRSQICIQNCIHSLPPTDPIKRQMPITHAHSVWLWPVTMDILRTCSSAVLDPLYSLQFNEISWLMRLQQPTWDENGFNDGSRVFTTVSGEREESFTQFNYLTGLSHEEIQQLSNDYFNTFNYMYPFMDRERFFTNTMPKAIGDLRQVEGETTITLLVLALGKLAREGATGMPITQTDQSASGIRGGTADLPPGFSLFDKARQRTGFVATQYTLESIQIFSLEA